MYFLRIFITKGHFKTKTWALTRCLLWIILWVNNARHVWAQSYPNPANWTVERIPTLDEIGTGIVKAVVQDHEGYLWIGSNNGMAKFDGYRYKKYLSVRNDSTTLNHNRISFAYIDVHQELWVGTRLGLNRYLPECDCFKRYTVDPAFPNAMPDGEVNWITEDREERLWVATQNGGLYRYRKDPDEFERFLYRPQDPIDISAYQARTLLCDTAGNVWIGTGEPFVPSITGDGLIKFNPSTNEVTRYLHDPDDEFSLIDNRVSTLLQDSQGRIWVGSCQSGLHLYDPQNDRFLRMEKGGNYSPKVYAEPASIAPWSACPHIRVLHEDKWGGLWVGNFNGGLIRFDQDPSQNRLFVHEVNNQQSLGGNMIWTLFEDSQSRFWVGKMNNDGFSKIDPYLKKFQIHFDSEDISAIYEAPSLPGILWVGVWEKGFYRWDKTTGNLRHLAPPDESNSGLKSGVIQRFLEDQDQQLALATNSGLSFYDWEKETFTHHPIGLKESATQESISILDLHQDRKGTFWIGSWGSGLYKFDKKTGEYIHYPLPFIGGQESNTYNQSIYEVLEDSQGRLLLGTWMEGIYIFDPETETFRSYLPGVGITGIFESKPDQYWLITSTDGLIEFSTSKGILRRFDQEYGFPTSRIHSFLQDGDHIWLGSNAGLIYFNPREETFLTYDKSDGLNTLGFNIFSSYRTSDSTFYFGSEKGLVSFKAGQIFDHPIPPSVQIQDIKVFDQSFRDADTDSNGIRLTTWPEELVLAHWQNELTFDYVGLHYSDPANNHYRHRLIPYEDKWIEAVTKRTTRYTNLSPGTYRFEVIASNSDGVWTESPTGITIRIQPPWYQTWWAYLMYIIITISGLWGAYQYQKQRWKAQAKSDREQAEFARLKELDEFKSRFYTNITHEFRTPLTVIKGLADEIGGNPRWKTQERVNLIRDNSDKLLQLINQMLDLSKLEAGKLESNYVQGDVIKFLKYLVESFHSTASSNKNMLSFHTTVQRLEMDYDPVKLQQVIDNLVSNALKFTPEFGNIKVTAEQCDGEPGTKLLQIVVEDTGVGISQEKLPFIFDRFYQVDNSSIRQGEGTGLGLALVKELIQLMNGTIRAESEPEKGTRFIIQLPISNKAVLQQTIQPSPPLSSAEPTVATKLKAAPINPHESADLPVLLIVEDSQDVRYYLRSCLQDHYQLLEATDGRAGIEKAQAVIPDLIVSDVMMPVADGFELCQTLKTDERTNHIPIILLTAKATQIDKMEGLKYGADAYLSKPFDKEELLLRLDNLLALRQKIQQHYQGQSTDLTLEEDPFLQKVKALIAANLEDVDFGVMPLSRALGMSRVQVHRKLKALTDVSTSQYIRQIRLQKAHQLLKNSDFTIAEIGYQVGFKDPAHFSRAFSQYFGSAPSETRK